MEITRAVLMDLLDRVKRHMTQANSLLAAANMLQEAVNEHYQGYSAAAVRLAATSDIELLDALEFNFRCRFCEALLTRPQDYDNYQRCPGCAAVYGFNEVGDDSEFCSNAAEILGAPEGALEVVSIDEPSDFLTKEGQSTAEGVKAFVYFARIRR